MKIYLHSPPLSIERTQVVEILPHGRQGFVYCTARGLVLTWSCREPGHLQPSQNILVSVLESAEGLITSKGPQIARFMGPTWGPPGSCRPQVDPMLAPCTLLSGSQYVIYHITEIFSKICAICLFGIPPQKWCYWVGTCLWHITVWGGGY